jgi:hypothetical protein
MTYFDCFVIGAWAFAFGWSVGAIYMHNHANKLAEKPERAALVEGPARIGQLQRWLQPERFSAGSL